MESYPIIHRISKEALRTQLLNNRSNIAVVDVRDSDHVGGHIKGSLHRPSTTLKYEMPSLVKELQTKPVVVFHCALSQQRGPWNALRYMEQRRAMLSSGAIKPLHQAADHAGVSTDVKSKSDEEGISEQQMKALEAGSLNPAGELHTAGSEVVSGGGSITGEANKEEGKKESGKEEDQVVYVLDGGFQEWQEKYGEDKELTDKYDKKLWQTEWY